MGLLIPKKLVQVGHVVTIMATIVARWAKWVGTGGILTVDFSQPRRLRWLRNEQLRRSSFFLPPLRVSPSHRKKIKKFTGSIWTSIGFWSMRPSPNPRGIVPSVAWRK